MSVRQLGAACKRYGPGRLPRADERIIGAGYAMASTALLACLLFLSGSLVAYQLGATEGLPLMYLLFGTAALPLVVVSGFFAGTVTWWILSSESPWYGALGGFIATCGTYLVATALLIPIFLVAAYGDWYFSVGGAAGSAIVVGFYGTLLTCWLTLPVGAIGGYLYERVHLDASQDTQKLSEQS